MPKEYGPISETRLIRDLTHERLITEKEEAARVAREELITKGIALLTPVITSAPNGFLFGFVRTSGESVYYTGVVKSGDGWYITNHNRRYDDESIIALLVSWDVTPDEMTVFIAKNEGIQS